MTKKLSKEEVYNIILELSKEIARKKMGALFVIAPKSKFKGVYEPLYPELVAGHSINEKGMRIVIEKLAELDGAFFIAENGELVTFGARIKKAHSIPGFGTRHAAASGVTTTLPDATAILVSEEVSWIRVFQGGKIILEMDSSVTPPSLMQDIVNFIADHDTTILTTAGATGLILGSFLPVVVVSGAYLAIKTATGIIQQSIKSMKK
ncbi:DNA integrity scanning protein DisA nucleotide-binding domain protein [Candidatus Woesearchaeota archaeon]|nr:DNA integrity scanning protein DisA nucleotide-binding domain protein [Candidatus Woesearchaeota archaeon]